MLEAALRTALALLVTAAISALPGPSVTAAQTGEPAPTTAAASDDRTGAATAEVGASEASSGHAGEALARPEAPGPTRSGGASSGHGAPGTAAAASDEDCADDAPVFDPSTPRLELQLSGGYAAFFHTWRQTSDAFMAPGAHLDGLYHGPVLRGEAAFAMGSLSLAAIYTHTWLTHDGTADPVQFGFLSGELALQCACRGSTYVWSFGLEVGADVLSAGRTVFVSIEHRSMFYVWEELFLGFDVDFATFVGLTSGGASGGGIIANVFVGYSLG